MKKVFRLAVSSLVLYAVSKAGYIRGWLDGAQETMGEMGTPKRVYKLKNGTEITITKNNKITSRG